MGLSSFPDDGAGEVDGSTRVQGADEVDEGFVGVAQKDAVAVLDGLLPVQGGVEAAHDE
jgi:hypothetical protein